MKKIIILVLCIATAACSKKKNTSCWTCTYPYSPGYTTICDNPSVPGYDSDIANNHNAYLKYRPNMTCSKQ